MLTLLILLNTFFVSFLDKPEKIEPALSPRAVEQRAQWNIPTDELDYPVCVHDVDSLRQMGATICHTSRWFNGATVEMTTDLAKAVEALGFVTAVEMTRDNSHAIVRKRLQKREWSVTTSPDPPMETDEQLAVYNLHPLHNAGYEGQGILMTVCDGGFTQANTLSCFRQSLELGHFDFTDDTDDFYGSTGTHGTECLSTISGIMYDYYGAATKAQYYLMRSEEMENDRESPKEMDNLVAALEKADSLGVNVFSVSLGYAKFDNSSWTLKHEDLDGKKTRVSRAATIAARKGMLVCVAAGNEGDDNWQKISVPADADSVLTVGAVDTDGYIGYFSSYGPSADGRVKPDVCAVGVGSAVIYPAYGVIYGNGTSFATPLLAGLAASLWSALPEENAMQIRERIIRSSDRYANPDPTRYGYGIPDAWKAYTMTLDTDRPAVENGVKTTKMLRDGHLYILRGDKLYTITGAAL